MFLLHISERKGGMKNEKGNSPAACRRNGDHDTCLLRDKRKAGVSKRDAGRHRLQRRCAGDEERKDCLRVGKGY